MTSHEGFDDLTPTACRHAQSALAERRIGGDPLDAEQEATLRAHLDTCGTCAEVDKIMQNFGKLPPVTTEMARLRITRAARTEYFRKREKRRAVLRWGALAAAAAVALMVYPLVRDTTDTKDQPWVSGERRSLLDGRATLFSSPESQIRTVSPAPDTLHVYLDSGFVCADITPDPNRRIHFRVITPLGNVDIKGTVFAVTVSPGRVRVEVVRGEVAVGPNGTDQHFSVGAGAAFDMQNRRTERLDKAAEQHIRSLLGMPPMDTDARPADAPEITGTALSSSEETGDTAPLPPSSRSGRQSPRPALKALLDEAAECRIKKDWRSAARAYEQVVATYPHRKEAATAMVSLGQIQLKHLGRPKEARRNFERYQKTQPSGPLSEQALYGIALADRATGNLRGEKQALERFVARHPSSPLIGSARQRLAELQKK